jgi:cytochrome P450
MLTIKDFDLAKRVLSSGEEFGAPSMSNYIELLEKEAGIDFSCLKKYLQSFLPFMHGENHLRIRKLVNQLFTRSAVKQWIPNISEAVDHRLCQLGSHSHVDLIIDIVDPFYMDLVEMLFGVKLSDKKKFIRQIEIATNAVERMASISQLLKLQEILVELDALVTAQLNTFESNTLFREIVDHTKDEMSLDDVVTLLLVLLIAPRATTETIAHIIVAFCELNPEKLKKFSSITWVDEHINDLIRLYASTNLISREAKKDV